MRGLDPDATEDMGDDQSAEGSSAHHDQSVDQDGSLEGTAQYI